MLPNKFGMSFIAITSYFTLSKIKLTIKEDTADVSSTAPLLFIWKNVSWIFLSVNVFIFETFLKLIDNYIDKIYNILKLLFCKWTKAFIK